jgi:capsular exopolysaccharide synthesis family protein
MALFIGLVGGVGLCFLVDYVDDTVKGPEDIEKITGLPSLGIISYLPSKGAMRGKGYASYLKHRYSYGKKHPDRQHSLPEVKEIELVNHLYPDNLLGEEYRTVRTSILLSHAEEPPKVIGFTSAVTQEGKTSTVVNLAVSFAQLHQRVIVVDADLRKPRLHTLFNLRNATGLTAFLTGKATLQDVIHKTFIENIWAVPSGPVPPNPAELLNSKRMKDLLAEASKAFDVVLLDSPPVLAVIDPVIISSIADNMVMVIRGGKTRRKTLLGAVGELRRARANILGVVLNAAGLSKEESAYSRNYQYDRYGLYGREESDHSPDN